MQNLMKAPHVERVVEQVVVGKDVLELVSGAMYLDPLTIFREYIQNAADAIDEARAEHLYTRAIRPRISITLDPQGRQIRIRDNGVGVRRSTFIRTITSLGASKKRGSNARGFRGIGRLAGLAYCQTLIFRTKATTDTKVTELHWDCRLLKQLLQDHTAAHSLDDIVKAITSIRTVDADDYPSHFFEVEMQKVVRYRNDLLLNEEAVRQYLSEVGPVPFDPEFTLGSAITSYLSKWHLDRSYCIYLNNADQPIYRPFSNTFSSRAGAEDMFLEFEPFQLDGLSEDVVAVGWILHHGYHGSLSEKLGFKGLRMRKGNIQIGSETIFDTAFQETRFNSWCVGELHILSQNIIPNGRRDNFDHNAHFLHAESQLKPIARTLTKRCRGESQARQALKDKMKPAASLTATQEASLKRFTSSKAEVCREIALLLYKMRGHAATELVSALFQQLS